MDDQNKKPDQDKNVQVPQEPTGEETPPVSQTPTPAEPQTESQTDESSDNASVPPTEENTTDTAPIADSTNSINPPAEPVTPEPEEPTPSEVPPAPIPQDVGYTETHSHKLVYILVAVLMVILFSLVGLFFYKQFMSDNSVPEAPAPVVQTSPTPDVSPTVTPANEEEAELQQIEIPDIENDLQEIEADLQQL